MEHKANLTSKTPQSVGRVGGWIFLNNLLFTERVLCFYLKDQGQGTTGPHLSCKQPTGSVGVSLVVGQEGRGEAGVGGVVRDAVLGVEKTLGVCRVDERRGASI